LKVAVLFMASSGIRVGAFSYLNVGNVEPLFDAEDDKKLACGKILVYAGEGDDEYETLISKEAYLTFQEYIQHRTDSGEKVTKKSPAIAVKRKLIGDDGNPIYRRCSPGTIRNSLTRVLWNIGMRKEQRKRHEIQVDHGLRKFFDNVAKDYIEEDYVEKLIGHHTGVKQHYDRHLPKPAIERYLKAMPYLSVGEAFRKEAELTQKLEVLEKEKKNEFNELRLKLLERTDETEELKKKQQATEAKLNAVLNTLQDKGVIDMLSKGARVEPKASQPE
jgi:hypothetical protein